MPEETDIRDLYYHGGHMRSPRRIRGYPSRPESMVKRLGLVRAHVATQPRPRIHARPWRYRTRLDTQWSLEERAAQHIRGSLQERIFYKALVDHGLSPIHDFSFQPNFFGGRAELGGLVADFMFPLVQVVVQVQSYWHTISLEIERRDKDQAAILQSLGFLVLELWPNTIEDQAALDLWIERNIMTLWGTSRQGLGSSHGRDTAFLDLLGTTYGWDLTTIIEIFQLILRVLHGT